MKRLCLACLVLRDSETNSISYVESSIFLASPTAYEPKTQILEEAKNVGGRVDLFPDPIEAVKGSDVVVTDTLDLNGDEAEEAERLRVFGRYQVNARLTMAPKGAIAMHCLPAHSG